MDPRAAELMSKMAQLRLFVIFWRGGGNDLSAHLADHLDYMIAIEKAGRLFASGPLGERRHSDGMTIVRADSADQAAEIAAADPFVRAGLRSYTVEPWTVMEGRMSVSVNFSDRSMSVT